MWEDWFTQAFEVNEFSSSNSLWLTYFIMKTSDPQEDRQSSLSFKNVIFKKILQTVYTTNPDIIGVHFLCRGDADEEDMGYCFSPI